MKSLNKTLSLVLALCLVFSLMGVAGAADFKDDAKIQYNEAVDVMNSIGVINGIGNDTFAPTASVTRAEAAKMVAYAVLGADVAKNLPAATTKFTDVDATAFSWATGSINYLTSKGIINGTSATTFEPNGKITAFQLGKMLLCAAGYGVNGEFVGPNWNINVSVTSNSTGIFKDTKAESFSAPATREEAALYCFNGITKVAKVSYSKLDGMYKAVKDVNNDDNVLTLAETAYPKLKSNSAKEDSFGRPAIVWTNKGNEIGKYAATAKFAYTKDMNSAAGKQAIRKDLKDCTFGKDKNKADIELQPWENGKRATKIDNQKIVGYIASRSGNGTVVSVYTDDDDENIITAITVIKEDLAKVTFVNTAKKSVQFETVTENDVQETYEIDSDNPNYAAVKDLEEDDRVLITPLYNDTFDMYGAAKVAMPETETGFIGAIDTHNDKIYLGTTAYDIAAAKTEEVAKASVDTKNKATLWLDALGFVVDTDAEAEANTKFIFTLDSYSSLVEGKIVPMVKGVLTDGSIVDVAVDGVKKGEGEEDGKIQIGHLYEIITTANDVYQIKEPSDADTTGLANTCVKLIATDDDTYKDSVIHSYDKRLTDEIGAKCDNYYATDVKFVYVNTTAKTATVKTGVQKVTNIPDGSYAVIEEKGDKDVVTAVYLLNGIAATVDSDSLLYVPATNKDFEVEPVGSRALYNETTKKYETFDLYAAFKNGKLIEGGIAAKDISTPGFYSYAKSDDTDAYVLAPYTFADGKTAVKTYGRVKKDTYANKLITLVVNEKTEDEIEVSREIDISSAKICDSRSEDDQITNRITPTAKGLCRAIEENAQVAVSVIYDTTTNDADVVYIAAVVTNEDAAKAIEADKKMVTGELAEVDDALVLEAGSTANEETVKTAVEAKVDLKKVTVTVAKKTEGSYNVKLVSKAATKQTATKNITVTVAKTAEELDQEMVTDELAEVDDALVLEAGSTANEETVKTAVEAKVDLKKVTVTVAKKTEGSYNVKLVSKAATKQTAAKDITVTVAKTAEELDQEMVTGELAEVDDALVLEAGSTANEETVKTAVEAKVDLKKVTVTVAKKTEGSYNVKLVSKAATKQTAAKDITVTVNAG